MRFALAVLVVGTGCAQVFGIDDTSGPGATNDVASVQVQRVSVGASIVKSPQDLSNEMATFYDDSAGTLAPVPGVLGASVDTFTAMVAGTPSAIVTVPDDVVPTRMFATPAAMQRSNYVVLEHPNPQEPPAASTIDVNVTLPTPYTFAGELLEIQAVGAWMRRQIGVEGPIEGGAAVTASIDYSVFNSSLGIAKRTRISAADVVLLLRYTGGTLSGVFQAQFDQVEGANPMSGTMTAVAANRMLEVATMSTTYATRFAAARPAVGQMAQTWNVNAAPGHSIGVDTGVRLISGQIGPTDTSIMPVPMFGNPFESLDWKALLRFTALGQRQYTYTDSATGMTANIGLTASLVAIADATTPSNLTMPVGLPILIEANSATLVTDGMMLPLDLSQPVLVEGTLDKPTDTAYGLTLTEITVTADGLQRKVIIDAVTTGAATFKLPPELFVIGKTYYFTLRAYDGGLVNAATGDLQTLMVPYNVATLDSAVFTVGML